jgi:hypothetical protein
MEYNAQEEDCSDHTKLKLIILRCAYMMGMTIV